MNRCLTFRRQMKIGASTTSPHGAWQIFMEILRLSQFIVISVCMYWHEFYVIAFYLNYRSVHAFWFLSVHANIAAGSERGGAYSENGGPPTRQPCFPAVSFLLCDSRCAQHYTCRCHGISTGLRPLGLVAVAPQKTERENQSYII